jgi:acyl-CoA thioester hydrolase
MNMELFQQSVTVRWSDLDPNGHVRHSVYYDYGTFARVAYWQKYGFGPDWMMRHKFGPVLFREEAFFHRELNSGDELIIDMRLSGLSPDQRKWSMRHRIFRRDEVCATLNMDGAWFDLTTRRVSPPPRDLAERFEALARTEDFRLIEPGKGR